MIGEKEIVDKTISLRSYPENNLASMQLKEFLKKIKNYNSVLKTKYILITNGRKTLCFYINNNQAKCLKKVPIGHWAYHSIDGVPKKSHYKSHFP